MKFLQTFSYSARDWHDWIGITNISYDKTPAEVALEYVHKFMIQDGFVIDKIMIEDAINGTGSAYKIPVVSTVEYPNGNVRVVNEGYLCVTENKISLEDSQLTAVFTISEEEISDEDLCFLIIEEFHALPKLAPNVMRFYEPPVYSLKEAEEKVRNFVFHEECGTEPSSVFALPFSKKQYEKDKNDIESFVGANVAYIEQKKRNPNDKFCIIAGAKTWQKQNCEAKEELSDLEDTEMQLS